jgi:SAM-dependent methyltransferase
MATDWHGRWTEINGSRPWFLVRWAYRRMRFAAWHLCDRAFGVRTAFVEPTGALEPDDPNANFTKPCPWLTTYRALRSLPVGSDEVLIDIGSGTGRAAMIASMFPFRRVIGVERDAALHRRAVDNVAAVRLPRHAPVELICADALECQLSDEVTVVFLYNPFAGETFRRVIEGVFASCDRVPRPLRLVYINPVEHEYLLSTGRCRLVRTVGGMRPTERWARMLAAYIYEVTPAAAPAAELAQSRLPSSES